MQQSSAPCFCLPFFGKKKGYSGKKDKKRTVWGKRNDKPPPAPRFFYMPRVLHDIQKWCKIIICRIGTVDSVIYCNKTDIFLREHHFTDMDKTTN